MTWYVRLTRVVNGGRKSDVYVRPEAVDVVLGLDGGTRLWLRAGGNDYLDVTETPEETVRLLEHRD